MKPVETAIPMTRPDVVMKLVRFAVLVTLVPVFTGPSSFAKALDDDSKDTKLAGQQIYQQQCASCHGEKGQGNPDEFDEPLQGALSLASLTTYIEKTMPEGNPEACVGNDARLVAKHVFEEFYSESARIRNNPARIQLSRLTPQQFRNSVAELVGSFRPAPWYPSERGLDAHYFAARNWSEDRRISKQRDACIDFAQGVPHFDPTGQYEVLKKRKKRKGENKMNDGFSAHWLGSLIPDETGVYQIVVETKNGFRLKLNDPENDLIDRRVVSDEQLEHRAEIFMLAGRMYRFHLEMFSYPDPPAQIRVLWQPPNKPLTLIPPSAFVPAMSSELTSVPTQFPPDDASFGFERGISVSSDWDRSATEATIFVANHIADKIWSLAKTKPTDKDATKKIEQFCHDFVVRAFVAKLSGAEHWKYVGQHFEKKNLSIEDQVKRVVIMTLKSPRFLYPSIQKRESQLEQARRMSLALWDSLPDAQLDKLAREGNLSDDKLNGELYRMVEDPRSKQKLMSFFAFWLKTDHASDASKDKDAFPDFDEKLVADLKKSLFLFLDQVIWNKRSDFRELFMANHLYLNDRLASFYGYDSIATKTNESDDSQSDPFAFKKIETESRAGILTHPYLMTGLAYHKDSSPIHRGVFVAKSLLGRRLRQPPDSVEPLTEDFAPAMTTRQRVEHQTRETTCMNCHSVINPLGFNLENFDAVGRFRTSEKDKPIVVSSIYEAPDGEKVELNGPRDLAKYLSENSFAQKSFVRQLFNHYTKQPIEAYGPDLLDKLHKQFKQNQFSVRQLLVDITRTVIKHPNEQR